MTAQVEANATNRIIYVGGYGRSGSTLVSRVLGQISGVAEVGELRHCWDRGFARNELCGCGLPFLKCPFWNEVLAAGFGSAERAPSREMAALSERVVRHRHLFALLTAKRGRVVRFFEDAERYASVLGVIYRAIHQVSQCPVIVDSSKEAGFALLLARFTMLDLRVIHLIRDSRAVAYAWSKVVRRPDSGISDTYMAKFGPTRSAIQWNYHNLALELLRNRARSYVRLRYEDLVGDFPLSLGQALRFIDPPLARSIGAIDPSAVSLRPTHSVSGNPIRFQTGGLTVRVDDAWKDAFGGMNRAIVTGLTLPLLSRYGYHSDPRQTQGVVARHLGRNATDD